MVWNHRREPLQCEAIGECDGNGFALWMKGTMITRTMYPPMRLIPAALLATLAYAAACATVEAAPAETGTIVPTPATTAKFVGVLYKGPGGRDYQIDHEGGRIGFGVREEKTLVFQGSGPIPVGASGQQGPVSGTFVLHTPGCRPVAFAAKGRMILRPFHGPGATERSELRLTGNAPVLKDCQVAGFRPWSFALVEDGPQFMR